MSADAPPRAEVLFYEALELPSDAREAFLNDACEADGSLRAEVEELLSAHDGAAGFLQVDAPASPKLEAEFARLKPEEAGERIGNYKLLEQIGEGGFGVVWVAEQEKPMQRRVALKIIKLGMDTRDVIARFEQERQALAMMDHPNIAKVLDAGATPFGRPFFAMELVRGIKITEYCDQANLPTEERLRLFIAVCHAVQHAHQKGIIHRDLKPSNILVTLHDGVPVPKVIDFGVAKATQQQRLTDLTIYTQFEQMIGTPLYMSPEQAEMSGLDIDTRSDIYSLGVLLYELLVGRTPFDPQELMKAGFDEMRRVIREQEPQKPSTFLSTMALDLRTNVAKHRQTDIAKLPGLIRGDLDWIVMKALEKDRTRRYETANGLANDIERHLLSEPVQARPPTRIYRFRRFAKRNKVAFAASAAIAAALIAGTAISTWQALRAEREATRANAALSDLRASAPAFAEQARALVASERFDEAIQKLDLAIKLQPEEADYVVSKADLLQSQLRFSEAAPLYRSALRLRPAHFRAQASAELCDKLAGELAAKSELSRESLGQLFATMSKESRPAAEMIRIGELLGKENELLLGYWIERLKDLPIPPARPLKERLTLDNNGDLRLDLSSTDITDLSPLQGMPLRSLVLSRCLQIRDLSPLGGMPLQSLLLDITEVMDLQPLQGLKALTNLTLTRTRIRDLSALHRLGLKALELEGTLVSDLTPLIGMPLERLNLRKTPVADLTPLQSLPLKTLILSRTRVTDLKPLVGTRLNELDCTGILALDFSPLAKIPLQALSLQETRVRDLSFLREMPLRMLALDGSLEASGYRVLSEIDTLEVLTLPGILVPDEFRAIDTLRNHPALREIEMDELIVSREVFFPLSAGPKEAFWSKYNHSAQVVEALMVAEALVREGRFSESADLLRAKVIDPAHFVHWISLGTAVYASGDHAGYRTICKQMMERFRYRTEGDEHSVRLSLLSADSGVPMTELRALMPHMALLRDDGFWLSYFLLTNGLLEYRSGHYPEAIELLRKVRSERFPWLNATADVVISMVYCQLGELLTAKTALGRARDAITAVWPNGRAAIYASFDWLYSYLLLQEAEQLIANSASPQGVK